MTADNVVTVYCEGCHRRERVSLAEAIASGWPVCHGQTMQLVGRFVAADVDDAVARALEPARMARAAHERPRR